MRTGSAIINFPFSVPVTGYSLEDVLQFDTTVSSLANGAHDKHGKWFYLLQVTEVMRSSYVGESESYDQTKVKRGRTTDWT